MVKLCYQLWKPQAEKLTVLTQAMKIIDEYEKKGYTLTLRQLYYQFVARDYLANSARSYGLVGDVVNRGRLAGYISWTSIEDRTRNLMGTETWECPAHVVTEVRRNYKRDLWANQKFRPEVWVEKEALVGVVSKVCAEYRVNFFGCRGYNSQSEQWRAGQRFARYVEAGQVPLVFHLGDHDPSGLDMTRDNRDRLAMFAGVRVTVVRLALNFDQIEALRPPPNYAKVNDPRFADYQREFGESSWELDALSPEVIHDLIGKELYKLRDEEAWDRALLEEARDLETLDEAVQAMGGYNDPEGEPEEPREED